jgi:hypothetical protein
LCRFFHFSIIEIGEFTVGQLILFIKGAHEIAKMENPEPSDKKSGTPNELSQFLKQMNKGKK